MIASLCQWSRLGYSGCQFTTGGDSPTTGTLQLVAHLGTFVLLAPSLELERFFPVSPEVMVLAGDFERPRNAALS